MEPIQIQSSAFTGQTSIPSQYTCDGINISPPLSWSGIPAGTKSIALICDDPDAPSGDWVHWILFNIPPTVHSLKEGFSYHDKPSPEMVGGKNGRGQLEYTGPCPPSRTHRYFFKLFALDRALALPEGCSKQELLNAMEGHMLAYGELVGLYRRK
ncbi:MAG: YbhB/YbcL family Raf kinase inhibitor-like protein [Bacteroidales bacterium]|nr:YbhB/YbcL family Raf kinase inhibitor-like protein [Bacteroidales bacterium]